MSAVISMCYANLLIKKKISGNKYIVDCGNIEYSSRNIVFPVNSDLELNIDFAYFAECELQSGSEILKIKQIRPVNYSKLMAIFIVYGSYVNGYLKFDNKQIRATLPKLEFDAINRYYMGNINCILKTNYEPHLEIQGLAPWVSK